MGISCCQKVVDNLLSLNPSFSFPPSPDSLSPQTLIFSLSLSSPPFLYFPQDPFYVSAELLPPFFLLLLSYGVAMTPWVYVLSFIFSSPATAYVLLFCLNFFMGFALLIVDAILVYLEGTSSASLVHWYLLVPPFPSYCLARGMMYFSLDRPFKEIAASVTNEPLPSPLSDIWPFILSLCVQALVYTIFLVLVELLPFLLRVV